MKLKYYVYLYLREDGTPYYVGKGSSARAWTKSKGEIGMPTDKNRIIIAETKEKIRNSKKGKNTGPQSEETRKKKSESLKGKNLGKTRSEEFKRQRSLVLTGIKRGPYKKQKDKING